MQHREHSDALIAGEARRGIHQAELVTKIEARDGLVEKQRLPGFDRSPCGQLTEHARELHALLLSA